MMKACEATAFAEELGLVEEEPSWVKHTWEDLDEVTAFLLPDERILVSLMRRGKTPSQVASILNLPSRQLADKEMRRVGEIVKFYLRWKDTARKIPVPTLSVEKNLALLSFVRERFSRKRAEKMLGETQHRFSRKMIFLIDSIGRNGYPDLAQMLQETWSNKRLRPYTNGATGNRREWKGKRRAMIVDPWRYDMRNLLLKLVGKVDYGWGAQTIDWKELRGVSDCSGLVIELLKKVGRVPQNFRDTTAQGLAAFFSKHTRDPSIGDIVFYGRSWSKVTHVMVYVGKVEALNTEEAVGGMVGGDQSTTVERAKLIGANLYLRSSPNYRGDLLGYGVVS
jgi:hypothetical protein